MTIRIQEQEITNLTTSAKWMTPSGEMVDIVMGHGNGITILTSFGSDPVNFYLHTKYCVALGLDFGIRIL